MRTLTKDEIREIFKICFQEQLDFYREIAAAVYEIPSGEVTKEQRQAVKLLFYPTVYGRDDWMGI